MYIRVKLLNGFRESLTYSVPNDWRTDNLVGSIVEVPLQKRTEAAYVEEAFKNLTDADTYTIRAATSQEIVPSDPHYLSFIQKLSSYHVVDKFHFFKRIRHFLQEREQEVPQPNSVSELENVGNILTSEQQEIVQALIPQITAGNYYPSLLHGVTGSGKTEIYKKLILHAWELKKSSLLLLPEVSLAVQFSSLLKKQLPAHIPLYSFHSAVSVKEKKALWQRLLANQPVVIIGVHLPLLLPLPHLGLIIVDEEHDVGYQEKKHPKVNTKEAAFLRAQISSIPIVAGSATPSIASLYNVKQRGWHFFKLKKRFAGEFPVIKVVKLTDKKPRKNFWISKELEEALAVQLDKKEQTIIFLNRRGYSFFIQCKDCGFIPHCIQCSVSLTLHNNDRLRCHYCSFTEAMPASCASCKAGASSLLKKGIGTQQVVSILEKLFPQARIARADLDTTVNKKKWMETIKDFEAGTIDILVGTQTITKGYHFPQVTLVGILWADINLSLPFYNAAEITLQQLIQVAGRAGRQSHESRVIVQTMIDHPLYEYLNECDYEFFYACEIEKRTLVNYPPCVRFAEIELRHAIEAVVAQEAQELAQNLKSMVQKKHLGVIVLGPSQPPVHMIKNVCMRKIYLKGQNMADIIDLYRHVDKVLYSSIVFFTPNPLS